MPEICKKIINKKNNTRETILKALDILTPIVVNTLGPEGTPALLQREGMSPLNTKDGVTVSNSIIVKEQDVNTVIQSIKEAASKTVQDAGDGTTTSILLADALIREGIKLIEMGVVSPQELAQQIRNKTNEIVEKIKELIQPVENEQQQKFIALISSNGDEEISNKVVEALNRAGEDGVTTIVEGGESIEIDHVSGFCFDTGYHKFGTPGINFITNEAKQIGSCVEPSIICYNGELTDQVDLSNFLRKYTNEATDIPSGIIIVAHEFSGQILQYALDSRKMGIPFFLVKTPIEGSPISSRPLILRDLSVFLGCDIIEASSKALTKITDEEDYKDRITGSCARFEIERYKTTFYEGYGSDEYKNEYLKILKKQLEEANSDWDKDIIKHRIGKLVGGVVMIYVGGKTMIEMQEKKDRVEDAINATRAGIQEGILPGGGCALYYASMSLGDSIIDTLFKRALEYPISQILINAGLKKDVILDKVSEKFKNGEKFFGYDASKKMFINNMIEAGIIDPFKVTKSALYNSISIAIQMLTCGGIVYHDDYVTKKRDIHQFEG